MSASAGVGCLHDARLPFVVFLLIGMTEVGAEPPCVQVPCVKQPRSTMSHGIALPQAIHLDREECCSMARWLQWLGPGHGVGMAPPDATAAMWLGAHDISTIFIVSGTCHRPQKRATAHTGSGRRSVHRAPCCNVLYVHPVPWPPPQREHRCDAIRPHAAAVTRR